MKKPCLGIDGSAYNESANYAYFFNALFILSTVLSLTLLYPLAYFLREKRKTDNSYLDGKKLTFTGKLSTAYAIYLLGLLVSGFVIALLNIVSRYIDLPISEKWFNAAISAAAGAINFFFTSGRLLKWRTENIHYDSAIPEFSRLAKSPFKCLIMKALTAILGVVTIGISYPFAYKLRQSYYIDMSLCDGDDLILKGGFPKLVSYWFLGYFFSVITLGLFVPYLLYFLDKWTVENTHVQTPLSLTK